jgi:hypothetical protein
MSIFPFKGIETLGFYAILAVVRREHMPAICAIIRPIGHYDPLRNNGYPRKTARRSHDKRDRILSAHSYAILRYATSPDPIYKRPDLQPTPGFYQSRDHSNSPKPAATASSKGPAPSGGKGGSGGGSGAAMLHAFLAMVQPSPSPSHPTTHLAGVPLEKRYTYG